ncbi:Glutaredoxin 3 (Grx2) [Limimaricola hongkongensis DSM 17492]|uniref:Glutaredoxin n=1 Tax=Limimaricola hongkongensis DSM 17492 TaxID=1122180 RepID=A0A017HFS7_9RHOB|nr:Glutaredoxin 3 (Grx2) [Limimaricola hongkongensis DSM 17492]
MPDAIPQIEIYTSPTCGYCHAAKRLLAHKGVSYNEINVAAQPERRAEMVQRANGGRTVPQIFIGGTHVGGYDDMALLDRRGGLDPMLGK